MSGDCIFCRIVAGEIPSQAVSETDRVLAFRDINPAAPHHILVVPKRHIADSLVDLNLDDPEQADIWAEMIRVVQTVTKGVDFSNGWRLVSNIGDDGRQSVYHLHVHVLAGRLFGWPPG
jgi:histidine triad (HIT) family protein